MNSETNFKQLSFTHDIKHVFEVNVMENIFSISLIDKGNAIQINDHDDSWSIDTSPELRCNFKSCLLNFLRFFWTMSRLNILWSFLLILTCFIILFLFLGNLCKIFLIFALLSKSTFLLFIRDVSQGLIRRVTVIILGLSVKHLCLKGLCKLTSDTKFS